MRLVDLRWCYFASKIDFVRKTVKSQEVCENIFSKVFLVPWVFRMPLQNFSDGVILAILILRLDFNEIGIMSHFLVCKVTITNRSVQLICVLLYFLPDFHSKKDA